MPCAPQLQLPKVAHACKRRIQYARMMHGHGVQADFPDRGVSPERRRAVAAGKKKGVNLTVAAKKAGYVPPHQRGADGSRVQTVEGFDADEAASRIRSAMARKEKNRVIEGAEAPELTKNQIKNQKKKAAKARSKAPQDDGGVEAATDAVAEASVADPVDPAKRLRCDRGLLNSWPLKLWCFACLRPPQYKMIPVPSESHSCLQQLAEALGKDRGGEREEGGRKCIDRRTGGQHCQ